MNFANLVFDQEIMPPEIPVPALYVPQASSGVAARSDERKSFAFCELRVGDTNWIR